MPQIKGFQVDLNLADLNDGSLSASVSTGLFSGGQLSFGTLSGSPLTTALISVSAGSGIIVNNYTDPENPTYTLVSWDAFTDIAVTDIATVDRTFVGINAAGTLIQQTSEFTCAQRRDIISFGTVGHVTNVNVVAVRSDPPAAFDVYARLVDIARALGPFNIEGNVYSANGANLNVDKDAGLSYRNGNNFHTDKACPDVTTDGAETILEWNYSYMDGSGGYTLTVKTSTIVPNNYDDGDGGLGTVGTNTWTIQEIVHFPGGAGHRIEYGQATFGSSADALAAVPDINHEHNPAFIDGIHRCYLVIRGGATDLSDPADAIFVEAAKFASGGGGAGAAGNLDGLTDVIITQASPLVDNEVLVFDSGSGSWINQTPQAAGMANAYHVDVTTGVGSPLAMTDTTLPSGWTTAYNSTGNFTITHNLGNAEVGFALSVLYNGTARVINPTSITTNAITFQITDTLDVAVEGNVVGKLLF